MRKGDTQKPHGMSDNGSGNVRLVVIYLYAK